MQWLFTIAKVAFRPGANKYKHGDLSRLFFEKNIINH